MASRDYKKLTEQFDTPGARTKRSKNRRADRLKKFIAAGWSGESEFLTAVGNGEVEVPPKPVNAAQAAQKGSE